MGKMRISIFAKELGIKSSEIIKKCQEKGFDKVHHHANTLEDDQVEVLRQLFKSPAAAVETKPAQVKPAAAVETKPAQAKPAAAVETKPAQAKPVAAVETKPAQAKPAAAVGTKPAHTRPAAPVKAEGRPSGPNVGGRQFDNKGKSNDGQKTQPQSGNVKRFIKIQPNRGGPTRFNKQQPPRAGGGAGGTGTGTVSGGGGTGSGGGGFTKDKGKKGGGRGFSQGGRRGYNRFQQRERKPEKQPVIERSKDIQIVLPISVKDLSNKLGVKVNEIIAKLLLENSIRATVNQNVDRDIVEMLGIDYGFEIEIKEASSVEEDFIAQKQAGKAEDMVERTPIVAFLGHVDHGKTSLLDSIRKTNVATGEAGGITQHMGAYYVEANGKRVIFLDTPGHEAFTAMRARGADVTDVVVLVVAADDGVMPQTEEALDHAKAANVPILVAINKVDKPGANVLKVKQQLATLELSPEEWGGSTQVVETSAISGQGLDELIEKLLLEAEILDLKYNPKNDASGIVLEAQIHGGKGVMANVLVRDGILKLGDNIFCGHTYGKVRAMFTDRGVPVKQSGPEAPLLISDFSDVPNAGDRFYVVDDISKAKDIALQKQEKSRESDLADRIHVTLDNLFSKIEEDNIKEIRVILKADFKGSVEVLKKTVEGLSIGEINIRAIHVGVGNITESDVLLADASDAIVIGFCVNPDDKGRVMADEKGVEIRLYKVIYDVTKDIEAAMEGMLEPEKRDQVIGHVEIQRLFKISRLGNIAGCFVKSGKITRNSLVRLIRDNVVLHSGKLDSLRTDKDSSKEVKAGFECGVKISGFNDIKIGDIIEAYEIQTIARSLK